MNFLVKWTTDEDALLIKLAGEGKSGKQAAIAIGRYSRNACIGRLHRLRKMGVTTLHFSGQWEPSAKPSAKKKTKTVTVAKTTLAPPPGSVIPASELAAKRISRATRSGGQTLAAKRRIEKSGVSLPVSTIVNIPVLSSSSFHMPDEPAAMPPDALASLRPKSGPVLFLDRPQGRCAWPLWEDRSTPLDQKFVCGEVCTSRSYCSHHAEINKGKGTPSERSAHRVSASARVLEEAM